MINHLVLYGCKHQVKNVAIGTLIAFFLDLRNLQDNTFPLESIPFLCQKSQVLDSRKHKVIKGLSLGHQIDLLSHSVVDNCNIKHIKFIMMKNGGVIILISRFGHINKPTNVIKYK